MRSTLNEKQIAAVLRGCEAAKAFNALNGLEEPCQMACRAVKVTLKSLLGDKQGVHVTSVLLHGPDPSVELIQTAVMDSFVELSPFGKIQKLIGVALREAQDPIMKILLERLDLELDEHESGGGVDLVDFDDQAAVSLRAYVIAEGYAVSYYWDVINYLVPDVRVTVEK